MKQKLLEINILRAIACIAVILVHITATAISSETAGITTKTFYSVINRSLKFTTPTFIFISALILFYNYQERKINYTKFWLKRFKAILIPYLLWTITYYVYFIYKGYYVLSVEFFLDKLLFADMVYHLYFVLIIFQFYMLFGIFHYLFKNFNSHYLIFLFFLINAAFIKYVHFMYVDRFFMQYIFFFALGCYCAKNYNFIKERVFKYKFLIAVGYVAISGIYSFQFINNIIFGKMYDGFLTSMVWVIFTTIAIFFYFYLANIILNSKQKKLKTILFSISDSSYYIYLGHPFVLYIALDLQKYLAINSTSLNMLITLIIVLGIIIPLAILYKSKKFLVINYFKAVKDTMTS